MEGLGFVRLVLVDKRGWALLMALVSLHRGGGGQPEEGWGFQRE